MDLTAGDTIWLSESGSISTVFRVLDVCDPAAATTCLHSPVGFETLFTVQATGTYYIVLEATMPASPSWPFDYDFTVELVTPEADCADGVDNDHDGQTDCADSDCTLAQNCITYTGTYEGFGNVGADDDNDLEGCTISFTPATTRCGFYLDNVAIWDY